jgi:hypothetical protein
MDAISREDLVLMGLFTLMDDADMKLATLGLMLVRQRMPEGRSFGAILQANEALSLSPEVKTQIHTLDYPPVDPTDFFKEVRAAMAKEDVTFTQLLGTVLSKEESPTDQERLAKSPPFFLKVTRLDGNYANKAAVFNVKQISIVRPYDDHARVRVEGINADNTYGVSESFQMVADQIARHVGVCLPGDSPSKCQNAAFMGVEGRDEDQPQRLVNKSLVRKIDCRRDGGADIACGVGDVTLSCRTPYEKVCAMLLG